VSSRFTVKLRREIEANPKKAGVLALLLVVAIWFWAPLLGKWFGKTETDVKDGAPTPNIATVSPTAGANGVSAPAVGATESALSLKSKLPNRPWRQLVTLIEQDPRMSPATELAAGRDPFKSLPTESAEKKQTESAPEQPDLTPTAAGLVLTSTIVGRGQKIALIGGESYKEGSVVAARRGEADFRLIEIRPREVILERKGRLYNLSLPTNEWATRR
jgi:hypothetical protein